MTGNNANTDKLMLVLSANAEQHGDLSMLLPLRSEQSVRQLASAKDVFAERLSVEAVPKTYRLQIPNKRVDTRVSSRHNER